MAKNIGYVLMGLAVFFLGSVVTASSLDTICNVGAEVTAHVNGNKTFQFIIRSVAKINSVECPISVGQVYQATNIQADDQGDPLRIFYFSVGQSFTVPISQGSAMGPSGVTKWIDWGSVTLVDNPKNNRTTLSVLLNIDNVELISQENTKKDFIFNKNLSFGMRYKDVLELQKFLNFYSSSTQVALMGPGSPGNESLYFGPATMKAVTAFQKSQMIRPSSGFFGDKTRTAVNFITSRSVGIE